MHKLLVVSLLAAALVAAGCGTKTVSDTGANGQTTTRTVPNVHFAKTKFLLHAGLAFGAFHRYIEKPLRNGSFKSGAPGQKKAIAKAAAAGLFIYHELKQARDAALSSDLLRRQVVNRLDAAINKIKSLASSLKSGAISPGDIVGASGALGALKSAAGTAGADIKDAPGPIPGL